MHVDGEVLMVIYSTPENFVVEHSWDAAQRRSIYRVSGPHGPIGTHHSQELAMASADGHAARNRQITLRKCIVSNCGRIVKSEGAHHRMCDRCRRERTWGMI